MNPNLGKLIIIVGAVIMVAGIVVYFYYDKFHWIGRLPGDIRVEKENFKFYFPITTLILLSLLISLIAQIIKRFL